MISIFNTRTIGLSALRDGQSTAAKTGEDLTPQIVLIAVNDHIHHIAFLWCQNRLEYFSLDIILSLPGSARFSSSYTLRKLFTSRNRGCSRRNLRGHLRAKRGEEVNVLFMTTGDVTPVGKFLKAV